jgi:hypothetical protein
MLRQNRISNRHIHWCSGGFERMEQGNISIPDLGDPNLLIYQPHMGILPGRISGLIYYFTQKNKKGNDIDTPAHPLVKKRGDQRERSSS